MPNTLLMIISKYIAAHSVALIAKQGKLLYNNQELGDNSWGHSSVG